MSAIELLQEWYLSQCNEDWEHNYGISIGTLDNPGWSLDVDLTDTDLENVEFEVHSYGVGKDAELSGDEWLSCKVEGKKFIGRGGPRKLEEMVSVFLSFTKKQKA